MIIQRPAFIPEQAERWAEQHEARQVQSERAVEIERLMRQHDCLSLGYFLEERAAYRELVARCAHRGVPTPTPPRYYDPGKLRAGTETASPGAVPASQPTGQAPNATGSPRRIVRPSGGEVLDVY